MRISRDQMMMRMAEVVAMRGTCSRLQVGAVIARDSRVISLGYNGAPAGMDHCNHTLDEESACQRAVHAEANALVWAARVGIATMGSELYVTHMPCLRCAQLIINAGIVQVVYHWPYRLQEGIDLLTEAGVGSYRLW